MAVVVLFTGRQNGTLMKHLLEMYDPKKYGQIKFIEYYGPPVGEKNAIDQTIIIASALQDKTVDVLSLYDTFKDKMKGQFPYIVLTKDKVSPEKFEEIRKSFMKGGVPLHYFFTLEEEDLIKMFSGLKFFKKQT